MVTMVIVFLAGMYIAWNFVKQPTWIASKNRLIAQNMDWSKVIAILAALVALFQSGLFKNIPVLSQIGSVLETLIGYLKTMSNNVVSASSTAYGKVFKAKET